MKRFIALLAAILGLFASLLFVAPAQADSDGIYPRFNGVRFSSAHMCLEDNSWGSYYPSRLHTSANSWSGPRDFAMTYRGPATSGGYDSCDNGDFLPGNIIEFALYPNTGAWCFSANNPQIQWDGFRGFYVWQEKALILVNYSRPGCWDNTKSIANINTLIAHFVGLKVEDYTSDFYSVCNTNRAGTIPYPTSNDLTRVLDRY